MLGRRVMRGWSVACAALLCGVVLAVLVAGAPGPAGADEGVDNGGDSSSCRKMPRQVPNLVPRAEVQDGDCLKDLTTAHTKDTGHTQEDDWRGLNAQGTNNPTGVPGLQVDGYFPDERTTPTTNTYNGWVHDSQFVVRFPNDWNGKLVITGAPGVRRQYANDFIISDWVLARGYAFASTDKGNGGVEFYDDESEPGGSVLEWHRRVEQLTKATKAAVKKYYGEAPERTYITGISNGGYLTRYALENTPALYDGGVDWEGVLWLPDGPNLLNFLPQALRNFPNYRESGSLAAYGAMIKAGFEPGSEFLWPFYITWYWGLTQRIFREPFDPTYPGAEAEYNYLGRTSPPPQAPGPVQRQAQEIKDAVKKVSLTGKIGKPLITLHGTLDALILMTKSSDVYTGLIKKEGRSDKHRYYRIEEGTHVDSLYDSFPDKLRPILPCYRASFEVLERWIEEDREPPPSQSVSKPEGSDVVNSCPPHL